MYVVRARLRDAHDVATDLWQMAESAGSPDLLGHAHRSLGVTLMDMGDLTRALDHLEEAVVRADAAGERASATLSALAPSVACRCYAARALWPLGYPDRARQRIAEALALAETRRDPHSLAFALTFAAIIHHFRGEPALARERAERSRALSREHGLRQTLVGATIRCGWALADQGRRRDGIALMREGLTAFRGMGIEINRPQFLAVLADALRGEGRFDEALELLAEAVATIESRDEHYYEPEVYRLRGRLLVERASGAAGPRRDESEVCFRRAIAIARRMGARSWELRAAMDLARLQIRRGRPAQARELLAAVHECFTEGFDTRDLVEARALLDHLVG